MSESARLARPRHSLSAHLGTLAGLLASMRFAIAMLVVVAIASCIGSILPQEQPLSAYINRYGEIWGRTFVFAHLDDIYHAAWFLLLVALLALSTAVCLYRNTPAMIKLAFSYQSHVNQRYLEGLEHSTRLGWLPAAGDPDSAIRARLALNGFALRSGTLRGTTTKRLHAAKKGGSRRIGYILTHGAIVLICVAALGNGDIFVRARLMLGLQRLETRDLPVARVPAASVLSPSTQSYRGQVTVVESETVHSAVIQFGSGYLIQPLPFNLKMQAFRVEYYPNGQPRDFVSDIELTDRDGTKPRRYQLRVNHPVTDHGVTLFQSGFEDGGTQIDFRFDAINGQHTDVKANVGASAPVLIDARPWTLEPTTFTRVNIQRSRDEKPAALIDRFLHNDALTRRDLGPSIAFTLRDMSGQPVNWLAFISPLDIDGNRYQTFGVRHGDAIDYSFIKVPVDQAGSMHTFDTLASRLQDRALRSRAAATLAPDGQQSTADAAAALLDVFAARGYDGVEQTILRTVPDKDRPGAATLFMTLLDRAVAQMMSDAPQDAGARTTLADAMRAYSDMRRQDVAVLPVPIGYRQRSASGLQVTRQWGGGIVVAGFMLLALGVFLLYFVPERRAWVVLEPDGRHMLVAMTANRPMPTLAAEFEDLVQSLVDGERRTIRRKP